jgi:hypothetical protein
VEFFAASYSGFGRAISWTEGIAGLASVVEAEGARERRHVTGDLFVALLVEDAVAAARPQAWVRSAGAHASWLILPG